MCEYISELIETERAIKFQHSNRNKCAKIDNWKEKVENIAVDAKKDNVEKLSGQFPSVDFISSSILACCTSHLYPLMVCNIVLITTASITTTGDTDAVYLIALQ